MSLSQSVLDTLEGIVNGTVVHRPVISPKKILDAGCGTGVITCYLGERFPDALVWDINITPTPTIHDQPGGGGLLESPRSGMALVQRGCRGERCPGEPRLGMAESLLRCATSERLGSVLCLGGLDA